MTSSAANPYGRVLDDFAVVAADHPCENELGAAAYATRSLLAPRPMDSLRQERLDRRLRSLGDAGASTFRDRPGDLLAATWFASVRSAVLLHEGYLVDPSVEGAAEIEKLRADLGDRFWATPPDVWNAWGNKGRFRRRCRELLGEQSMPPGIELTTEAVGEIVAALTGFDAHPGGRTVVKLPGGGGGGNLVLSQDATESWPGRVEGLWDEQSHVPRPADVVIEAWLPWESTYSVSFLITPDHAPTPVAACEQIVEPAKGDWVGARSHGPLSRADVSSMVDHLRPVYDAMAADGIVGVAALDVIVGSPDAWSGRGLALHSGRRMLVVECNPRWNQHNRIGMVVERLARRWGIDSQALSWSLVYIDPPAGSTFPDLLASLEKDPRAFDDAPTLDRPTRMVFAHRLDTAMELTVSLAGQSAPTA